MSQGEIQHFGRLAGLPLSQWSQEETRAMEWKKPRLVPGLRDLPSGQGLFHDGCISGVSMPGGQEEELHGHWESAGGVRPEVPGLNLCDHRCIPGLYLPGWYQEELLEPSQESGDLPEGVSE